MTVAAAAPESRIEKGTRVPEKPGWPQQPVISIRISEVLRSRLDRLKEVLSRKSGENVTTSEVAKQLLESAREDRLEVAELLANATVALAAARRKAEAGLSLARAEWIVLAYYVQLGVESHIGVLISPETMKGILEAFLAAYRVRRGKKSSQDTHYLSNLPVLDKEGKPVFGAEAEGIDVLTAVERLIRKIDGPRDEEIWPQFAARNLYEFLEDESFGIEAMNQALASGGTRALSGSWRPGPGFLPERRFWARLGPGDFVRVRGRICLVLRDGKRARFIRAGEPAGRSPCDVRDRTLPDDYGVPVDAPGLGHERAEFVLAGPLVLWLHGHGDHGAACVGSLSGFRLIRVHV